MSKLLSRSLGYFHLEPILMRSYEMDRQKEVDLIEGRDTNDVIDWFIKKY
jgi:hypothetical protein